MIHSDIMEMPIAKDGSRYVITFTDDYSRGSIGISMMSEWIISKILVECRRGRCTGVPLLMLLTRTRPPKRCGTLGWDI
jgi:hypothetical protein